MSGKATLKACSLAAAICEGLCRVLAAGEPASEAETILSDGDAGEMSNEQPAKLTIKLNLNLQSRVVRAC